MVRFDLNRISMAGLVLGAIAAVLLCVEMALQTDLSMGNLFGDGAPFYHVHIYMVVALVGLVVYAIGRVVWLVKHHFGVPPRPPRS